MVHLPSELDNFSKCHFNTQRQIEGGVPGSDPRGLLIVRVTELTDKRYLAEGENKELPQQWTKDSRCILLLHQDDEIFVTRDDVLGYARQVLKIV